LSFTGMIAAGTVDGIIAAMTMVTEA